MPGTCLVPEILALEILAPEIPGVRRAVQYSKGALFLAELRDMLGETAFWNGLRLFTRRHSGGTVTSRDFQAAMEEASGRDLSPAFGLWVYGESATTRRLWLRSSYPEADIRSR